VAAEEALAGARSAAGPLPDPGRTGVILGGGVGGLFDSESYYRTVLGKGWKSVPATRALGHFPCATADRIAERHRFGGLRNTVVTACSSSTLAIGMAYDAVRSGAVDLAVTGGSDTLSRLTYSGFNALRSVDPDACRPFDARRKGLSLGEGAAILVLEPLESALERGAEVQGEVLGYGMSSDAHHMTAPHPDGEGAALAMGRAIRLAGLEPGDVDYINAHGTGTPHNDLAETRAIHRTFGERAASIPVSSTKSMLGHCLGSAGAMEALVTVLALRDGFLPPTAGLEQPDPGCDLDHVPLTSRAGNPRTAISNSFAFGGNNGCLVLGRYDER
jgi:3-oxoacyl-[acyl-carrier-protein] synthase II